MQEKLRWKAGWWEAAFPRTRNASELAGHARGNAVMLVVVAYDVTDPKRLKRVADCCMDYGMRVQYSVFECRLAADRFATFWKRLSEIIDPEEDRIVAYPIHGAAQKEIRTCGRMSCSEVVISYQF